MTLKINLIAAAGGVRPAKDVIETDLQQRRRAGVGGDVAAVVAAGDHRHGVPTVDALDATLNVTITGEGRLFVNGNCVDIRRVEARRVCRAVFLRSDLQLRDEEA